MKQLLKSDDKVKYIEYKNTLYYKKFKYKANFEINSYMKFFGWRKKLFNNLSKDEVKIRKEGVSVAVYSNTLDNFSSIEELTTDITITQCIPSPNDGVLYFINPPKGEYRMFLKQGFISDIIEKAKFMEFLNNNKESYKPSPSLKSWYNYTNTRWMSGNYFVDVSNQMMLSHLIIMFGELAGKVFKLERRSDIVN